MQTEFIVKKGRRRLLIIFAGWGMDSKPLATLSHPDFDILAVWDYRSAHFDLRLADGYDEICVIAWSFGVYASQDVLPWLADRLSACVAVAGTPYPVDDTRGIPEAVFRATREAMSERALQKFYRRMCGSAQAYNKFCDTMPERDIDGLIAELDAIPANKPMPFNGWTLAVLTANDAIFPFDNQCRAWEGTRKLETGWPHLPDFQYLVDNCLIDKSLVQARFSSATKTYDEEAEVQRMIGAQLWDLLRRERPALSGEILEVGPGTGVFTSFYIDSLGDVDWLYLMDLTPQQVRIPAHINMQYIQGDAEMDIRQVPSGSLDAIVSNCAIQWFSDAPSFAAQAMRVLKPGGVFAFSTFMPDNLHEFKAAAGVEGLLTPTTEQWSALAEKYAREWIRKGFSHTIEFSSPVEVLRHMKRTGVNALRQAIWTPSRLERFCKNYPCRANGSCPLTYHATTQVWIK